MLQRNYHTHTYRCQHATGDVIDYAKAAIEAGLTTLGMSDHAALPDNRWNNVRMSMPELDDYEERQMFLVDIGLDEPGSAKLIRSAYKLLNQQTYFTAGVKEVRAWTVTVGSTAPQAA